MMRVIQDSQTFVNLRTFPSGTLQEAAKIDLVKPQAHLERVIGSSGSMQLPSMRGNICHPQLSNFYREVLP